MAGQYLGVALGGTLIFVIYLMRYGRKNWRHCLWMALFIQVLVQAFVRFIFMVTR